MPIGPNNISTVRHDLVNRICFELDAILKDPRKSQQAVKGDSADYFYAFVFPGVLNPSEKQEIIEMYARPSCGWGKVDVVNSGDVPGERSGMIRIRLYLKPDSLHLKRPNA